MSDTIRYTLTFEEIQKGLWKTRRPLSRLVPQTVILLVLGLPSLCYAIIKGGDTGSLLLGIALPLLAALGWILPAVSFRREAQKLVSEGFSVTLTVTETDISVGGVAVPLAEATLIKADDLLLWQIERDQTVYIPRRVLSSEVWERLSSLAN